MPFPLGTDLAGAVLPAGRTTDRPLRLARLIMDAWSDDGRADLGASNNHKS